MDDDTKMVTADEARRRAEDYDRSARNAEAAVARMAGDPAMADAIHAWRDLARDSAEIAGAYRTIAALYAITEGRSEPPTDAELAAHAGRSGWWLVIEADDFGTYLIETPQDRDLYALTAEAWVACGEDGRPCAWPTVKP